VIAPSTQGAFALTRALCATRPCFVSNGPVTASAGWRLGAHLKNLTEIASAFAGQSTLPRTVVSFPDQHVGSGPACVQVPFLGARYSFSTFESILVIRHRPPVYALSSGRTLGDFKLHEVRYEELFNAEGHLLSLPGLVRRLLMHLEQELTSPPRDWLAQPFFMLKSQAMQCFHLREELKDIECLLRMHLQSRYCDRLRTATAIDAVAARRKLFTLVQEPSCASVQC
ncbi:MAG: hypothetical protein ABI885_27195, partial [Gammaproteobacteria bacterium]